MKEVGLAEVQDMVLVWRKRLGTESPSGRQAVFLENNLDLNFK